MDQPSNTGVDKRVLNLLRSNLENKQQREEQLNSQQPILVNHSQQSFQNKVVAPVEPKSNIGRHNLSPFTAANLLERNSNTPPHYKFHMPRAVDSITQEAAPRSLYSSRLNTSATLPGKEALLGPRGADNQIHRDKDDGLAAILAAKIRTKAELKQGCRTERKHSHERRGAQPNSSASAFRVGFRSSKKHGRSSSETSVFDFRESDSEGEMPVLERQTLEEMRRDRKQLSKVQPPVPLNDAVCMSTSTDLVKIELKENDKINEVDPFWTNTCDKFMEQLRERETRQRTRLHVGGGASSKHEDAAVESDRDSDTNAPSQAQICPGNIKKEPSFGNLSVEAKDDEPPEGKLKEDGDAVFKVKTEAVEAAELSKDDDKHSSDDSDEVPLIKRATRHKAIKKEDSDGDEEVICRKRRVRRGSRIKLVSSSGSDSSSEDSDGSTEFGRGSSVADRLRARKRSMNTCEGEGMKLRSRDTTPHKMNNPEKEPKLSPPKGGPSQKRKPKPLFGDGSDFRPGWEEEVYVYKKSLRMPTRLITVSKPSRFHRLSTSLPDLDPGSPALSVSMDSSDFFPSRKKLIDSDIESDYSFSIAGIGGKIDDEEATSSTTVSCPSKAMKHSRCPENSSIVDVLAQKVGSDKIDSKRKLSPKGSKVFNKSSNEPELLPTPSFTPLLSSETSSKSSRNKNPLKNNRSSLRVTDSNLLGYFRKETVNNFRDAFKNNHTLPNEFSTLVLKSRTRTETKVLKKEATIREVFGEDRPASAPPMQNRDDTSQDDDSQNETLESTLSKARTLKQRLVSRLKNSSIQRSRKVNKVIVERQNDLLKSIANKTLRRIKTELEEEETVQEETNDAREEENNELDDDKNDPEAPGKKRLKLRTSRRKFRSGFDYIRKKKKPMKRDETLPKEKKRQVLSRPNPECVGDIQSEIRTWVIKKGVGETILHRAARLGYTDVAAYCLEKLNNIPSPKDNAGYTPLHEACSKGHLEIAKLLLAYGANVSESANGGIRPLHEAAENGVTELVRLLLSYGADPLLATYSGQTPMMLAVDTEAHAILEQHLDDVQGRATVPWSFSATNIGVDSEETGCNPLDEVPLGSPESSLDDVEMEVSDINLPALFTLKNDSEKWVLLHDLMAILKVKSRDALLRQINPKAHSGPPAVAHREVMRELKLPDFLEQTRCCHLLSGGEKINVRGSKVTLIKYNDKVKSLLNVEKLLISLR
ncbi:BCoR-like protein 1 [Harpegnathos saltator]|uniref:BCoR-like protein 1 n=1 Tax=Harpegnathos saltator TaxID=610380 RepID=E2C7J1_HARSA|nr:BCoR-like protein 1 [Harpegnathos saltator]